MLLSLSFGDTDLYGMYTCTGIDYQKMLNFQKKGNSENHSIKKSPLMKCYLTSTLVTYGDFEAKPLNFALLNFTELDFLALEVMPLTIIGSLIHSFFFPR